MANGSAQYKFIDAKLGLSSGGAAPITAKQWTSSTTYAAGAVVQNGGHIFSTVAGGAGATSGVGPQPGALTDNSCTWVLVGSVGGVYASESVQSQDLGYIAIAKDFGPNSYGVAEFRYVKFTGSTAIKAGQFVVIDTAAATAVLAPAAAPGANKVSVLGVAMTNHALDVSTPTYGWVMIRGVYDGAHVVTTWTAGTTLGGGGTAGAGVTAATTNYIWDGAVLRSGGAAYLAVVEIYWPICSGR